MLAFLLIIGLSFVIMASSLSGMVGDFLLEERVQTARNDLKLLSEELAEPLKNRDAETLNRLMHRSAAQTNSRIILTDETGKVQLDTEQYDTGTFIGIPEVTDILTTGSTTRYTIRDQNTGETLKNSSLLLFTRIQNGNWQSFTSESVVYDSEIIGVAVLISPINTMINRVYNLQDQMVIIFIAVAAVALISSLLFARVLTKPVSSLTKGIRRMATGDFSARVAEKGSGEMLQMAKAFNSMSQKLETLDDSRNEFVSNASHELKTPLATMKVLLESLIEQPDMDKALRTEFMTDINNEIDRLSAIISDLLTLVKMDSGATHAEREMLSLAQLCKDASHLLEPLASKKEQTITLNLYDPCDMTADKSKLMQVVYNLMENAVKYTQNGGHILVNVERTGKSAVLTVKDDGPGIAPEHLPHVFDRFYRVDKARSRDTGGTGLGLSIVQQFVLLHNGTIHAESEVGKGTSFIVELPIG